jgi:hypothetical protein
LNRTNQLATIAKWAKAMQEAMKMDYPILACAMIGSEYEAKMREAVEQDRQE